MLWIGFLTVCCALLCAFPAMASEGDHWSIFTSIIPETTLHNFQAAWGKTWIAGDAYPGRIMHLIMSIVVFVLVLVFCLCHTIRIILNIENMVSFEWSVQEIARQCDYFQSVDNESPLVAEKTLKSSISPEYTVEVCQWTNVIIPYFHVT